MFVKWECGCKGIKFDKYNLVIDFCDYQDYGLVDRQMGEKPFTQLDHSEADLLIIKTNDLIQKGLELEKLKRILK